MCRIQSCICRGGGQVHGDRIVDAIQYGGVPGDMSCSGLDFCSIISRSLDLKMIAKTICIPFFSNLVRLLQSPLQ